MALPVPYLFGDRAGALTGIERTQLDIDLAISNTVGISATAFGARFDGVTDDTAALIRGITYIFNAGGGTLLLPAGTAMVSSVFFVWLGVTTTVNIKGAGTFATYLKKIDNSATPVLSLSAAGIIGVPLSLEDFSIIGNGLFNHTGLLLNRIAYIKTRNIRITLCDAGMLNTGSLVDTHYNFDSSFNSNGIQFRKSVDLVYSNLIQFIGGVLKNNTSFAIDFGDCNQVAFFGTDFEINGSSGNLGTGTIKIRALATGEFGHAVFSFTSCWFELNLGDNFVADNVANLDISMRDTLLLFSEGARGLNIGAIRSLLLENVLVDGVVCNASSFTQIGGVTSALTGTPGRSRYINASVNGVVYADYSTDVVLASNGSVRSGAYVSGTRIVYFGDVGGIGSPALSLYHNNGSIGNAAVCAAAVGTNTTSGRSVNAGGTINASNLDYAEYMRKRDDCGIVEKGQIVGVDVDGLLTDRFELAHSFVIKSTSPSFVGGDQWGEGLEGDEHEAARARVDRIAFCGQVPCILSDVLFKVGRWVVPRRYAVGDYVCARASKGRIIGVASSKAGKHCVGKIWAIRDGVPIVAVKVV